MRVAGDQKIVVSKVYQLKIFEQIVTVSYLKKQPPKSMPEGLHLS